MNKLLIFGVVFILAGCGFIAGGIMDKTLSGWAKFRLMISGAVVIIGGIELIIHQ